LLWVERLAKQNKKAATDVNILLLNSEVVYDSYVDCKCPRTNVRNVTCNGSTVLRSLSLEKRTGTVERVFIGCEHYRNREKGHMYYSVGDSDRKVDYPTLFRLFGESRSFIHQDILDSLGFTWDTESNDKQFRQGNRSKLLVIGSKLIISL